MYLPIFKSFLIEFSYPPPSHSPKSQECSYSIFLYQNNNPTIIQRAKKIIFRACHTGKLKLAFTSPAIISTSTESVLRSRIDFTVHSSENITCLSRKLKTEFIGPIAKSPRLAPGYRTILSLHADNQSCCENSPPSGGTSL